MAAPISIPDIALQLSDHLGRKEFFELLGICLELASRGGDEAVDVLEQLRASLLRAASHAMLPEALACARGLRADLRAEGSRDFYEMSLEIACDQGLAALAIELLDPPHPSMELGAWILRARASAISSGQADLGDTLAAMARSRLESAELRSELAHGQEEGRSGRSKAL